MCLVHSSEPSVIQVRTISVAPYGIDTGEELKGIYYEFVESLALESGYAAEHYIFPYARIIHELKFGITDITIMFKYAELKEYVDYLVPLPPIKNVVVGLKNKKFTSIKQLKGKTIAYLRGAKFSVQIDEDDEIVKYYTRDFRNGIEMLAAGRVDAVIGPYEALVYAAKLTNQKDDLLGSPFVVSERTPWLQMSKKSKYKTKSNKISLAFKNMIKNNYYAILREKYALNVPAVDP
jgi:polar amino acid transport system substrate-binding protein